MPIPTHAPGRLAAGIALPFRGLAYLARERRLWRIALFPILLTAAALIVGFIVLWPVSAKLLALAWAEPSGLLALFWMLAHLVLFLALALIAAVALPSVLAAPCTDSLSEKVEAIELGEPSSAGGGGVRRFFAAIGISLAKGIRQVAVFALGHALLLLLLVIPAVGAAYPVLAFLWSASWLAFEYLDLPMGRHLHRYSEVRGAMRKIRPLSLGFGSALAVCFLIPFAGFLVVPIGTVGGTLLYCDLVRSGLITREAAGRALQKTDPMAIAGIDAS